MKKATYTLCLAMAIFCLFSYNKYDGDCNLVITYAEMAMKQFKEASKTESIGDAASFLKKGIEQANEAAAYAVGDKCNCANAKNYALNAVAFGKKAQKATELKELKKNAKKAMNMSLDVVTTVPGCKKQ